MSGNLFNEPCIYVNRKNYDFRVNKFCEIIQALIKVNEISNCLCKHYDVLSIHSHVKQKQMWIVNIDSLTFIKGLQRI